MWAVCKCLKKPLPIKIAFNNFIYEVYFLSIYFSQLQFSNTIFSLGRLIGSIVKKPYIKLPGDYLAVENLKNQLLFYGCVFKNKCGGKDD